MWFAARPDGFTLLAMPIEALLPQLRAFVAERDWARFHDPKNLAMLLASEAGELLAEYRWISTGEADAASREPGLRARVADEIGDVGIALLLLCDRIGIDLAQAMAAKLELNRRRYPADQVRGRADRPASD
jgi:dCTP diphosphatase